MSTGTTPEVRRCAGWRSGCAPPPPTPLRIGLSRWIGYDTLWLANRLGFIAAEGQLFEQTETLAP